MQPIHALDNGNFCAEQVFVTISECIHIVNTFTALIHVVLRSPTGLERRSFVVVRLRDIGPTLHPRGEMGDCERASAR
jgi:hypothetical protein